LISSENEDESIADIKNQPKSIRQKINSFSVEGNNLLEYEPSDTEQLNRMSKIPSDQANDSSVGKRSPESPNANQAKIFVLNENDISEFGSSRTGKE